jgi:hypothetical protein
MRQLRATVFGIVMLLFAAACGQHLTFSRAGSIWPGGLFRGSAIFLAPPFHDARVVVTEAPYSGEDGAMPVRPPADGTQITGQARGGQKIWRDSQGRTRLGRPVHPDNAAAPTVIQINDAAGRYQYTMDTVNHVPCG